MEMSLRIQKHFFTRKGTKVTEKETLFIDCLTPFGAYFVFQLFTRFGNRRELMPPVVRHARIDQAARAVSFIFRRNANIQRTARSAPDDFDGLFRITPGRHCPENVELARGVNIVIDDYDESPVVSSAQDLRCEKEGLPRVARIGLFNRDHVEETADAGFERPDSFHIG